MFNKNIDNLDPFTDFVELTWPFTSMIRDVGSLNPWHEDDSFSLTPVFYTGSYRCYLKGQDTLRLLAIRYYQLFEFRTPKQNLAAYRMLANFWDDKVNSYEIDNDCVVTRLPYPFDPAKSDPLRDPVYPIYFLALLEVYDTFCEMQQHLMEQVGLLFKPEAC